MVQSNTLIDGRYRVIRKLGQGGGGCVYLVLHEQANRLLAMKVLQAPDEGVLQEELRILRSLRHRMLPEIEDVVTCGGSCCLIMRYIEGDTLRQVARKKRISLEEALAWGRELCDVLQYMHSRPVPVYHLDLKPSNIILGRDGRIYLVDFGSARNMYDGAEEDKGLSPCTGTPGYAAPELFQSGKQPDGQADVYSVGAVLYALLCGRKPRCGVSRRHCQRAMRTGGAEEGAALTELAGIMARCLCHDPEKRPSGCRQLQSLLARAAGEGRWRRAAQRGGAALAAACFLCSIFCLILSPLFGCAAAGMRGRVYEQDLQRAALASGEEKWTLLAEAVTLFPDREEAYMKLLDAVMGDGRLTEEESRKLTALLYGRGMMRGRENIAYLRDSKAAWTRFAYRMGLMYYYQAGENGDKNTAAGWLRETLGSVNAEEESAALTRARINAQVLLDLCEDYSESVTLTGSESVQRPGLWERMQRLLQAEPAQEEGERDWFLREWLRMFYDNMDVLEQLASAEEMEAALKEAALRLPPEGEEDEEPVLKELCSFYKVVTEEWTMLQQMRKG